MSINIQPIEDRVLILPEEAEVKTETGIYIPEEAKEIPHAGVIKAIGSGTKDRPMQRKVGERVVYSKYASTEIKYQGKEYVLVNTKDILAILQ